MRSNRAKDTGPELTFRKALWTAGLRGYRKNVKSLPGSPDVVFGSAKVAVFVHGCYWHRCPTCTRDLNPKRNAEFWQAKFERNVERDRKAQADLTAMGYRVVVVWECEIKKRIGEAVESVRQAIAAVAEA